MMAFLLFVSVYFLLLSRTVSSFVPVRYHDNKAAHRILSRHYMVGGSSAQDLLYQDQQEAMLRRALHEQELLQATRPKELKEPKIKKTTPKSGTGFASKSDPKKNIAQQQAKVIHRDGVLRINNVLSNDTADKLREYVLEQQEYAATETTKNPRLSRAYYGVENARKNRCDLQLSLLRGGYAASGGKDDAEYTSHPLADTLQELLGADGTLRPIYEHLVTPDGELYELATVITGPGSNQQTVHADLPFNPDAPLYVIFLALQDVDAAMGPTSFLVKTHTPEADALFNGNLEQKDDQLKNADCRLALLNKGDCVLFDARVLHCGNSNDSDKTRALFNFSFRNPVVQGNIGYDGSIMPGYVGALSLADVGDALKSFADNGSSDPFARYGNGLE